MSTDNLTYDTDILLRLNEVVRVNSLSKAAIARDTGYSKATVGAVLEGKTPLTSKFTKIFCSTYKVSERWLKTGVGEMFKVETGPDMRASENIPDPILTIINQELDRMDTEQRRAVLSYCLQVNGQQYELAKHHSTENRRKRIRGE